jgi:integrase
MPVKIYRRGKTWHYRGTVSGRRLRGSTGAQDRDIAARVAAEAEAKAWQRHLDGPQSILTFADAALHYRLAGKQTRFLDPIEQYWKNTLVKDIKPGNVRDAAITLLPKASGATRNRHVVVPTQAIINYAAESGRCAKISVPRFPVTTKVKKPATLQWVQSFMAVSPPHLGGLALFMFLTGARVSEALALEWADIDFTRQRALIRGTKIGMERWAHLPQPLIVALANIERDRKTVFRYTAKCSADKSWRAAIKRAGIEQLSFHSCRHGFATAMLHAGVDPITIAKRGGWKNAQHVFQTYGHASDDLTITDRICTNLTQPAAAAPTRKANSKS